MDANTYLIPFLVLALLLVFPIAFWAKSKFYPKEYKKDIDKLSSINFLVFVFVLALVGMLVKVFVAGRTYPTTRVFLSGAVLAAALLWFILAFRRIDSKERSFFAIAILFGLIYFIVNLIAWV